MLALAILASAAPLAAAAEGDGPSVPEMLRDALLSASDVQRAQVLSRGDQVWQVLFDAHALHTSFPDPLGRTALQRLGELLNAGSSTVMPGALFDVAFAGSEDQHTEQQQLLQAWLFDRCNRLPKAAAAAEGTGMRRQCVKSVASLAALLQQLPSQDSASLRRDLETLLGLNSRSAYAPPTRANLDEDHDVAQAAAAASSDAELQALLRKPGVAQAIREIASDPQALERVTDPDVKRALGYLNAHLMG